MAIVKLAEVAPKLPKTYTEKQVEIHRHVLKSSIKRGIMKFYVVVSQ